MRASPWFGGMAKHIWSILCRQGLVNKFTNGVSLIDAIEEIVIETERPPPQEWRLVPIQAVLVSFFERSDPAIPEQARVKIEIVAPNGDIHSKPLVSEIGLDDNVRSRTFVNMEGLPVHGFGAHRFLVSMSQDVGSAWMRVAELPLEYKPKDGQETVGISEPILPKKEKTSAKKKPLRLRLPTRARSFSSNRGAGFWRKAGGSSNPAFEPAQS